VHLTASTPPATNQSNTVALSLADEQPPSMTRFGQGAEAISSGMIAERFQAEETSNSLLDVVEPFRPLNPAPAPQVDPAQPAPVDNAPKAEPANARPLPPMTDLEIDAALDFTDARIFTHSRDDAPSRSDVRTADRATQFSLSALFGVAAVTAGGYHLVLRETDRIRGRAIPRWAGAERPTKQKRKVAAH
jgi:hypothetical protein